MQASVATALQQDVTYISPEASLAPGYHQGYAILHDRLPSISWELTNQLRPKTRKATWQSDCQADSADQRQVRRAHHRKDYFSVANQNLKVLLCNQAEGSLEEIRIRCRFSQKALHRLQAASARQDAQTVLNRSQSNDSDFWEQRNWASGEIWRFSFIHNQPEATDQIAASLGYLPEESAKEKQDWSAYEFTEVC